jgi:hypothetical protein
MIPVSFVCGADKRQASDRLDLLAEGEGATSGSSGAGV